MTVFLLLSSILLINVPFGYWRANSKKFSWPWIMAVHIPVPIAIGLRLMFLGWVWLLLPAFVAVYSIGQVVGGKLRKKMANQDTPLTSCLMLDIFRMLKARQSR